MNHLEYARQIQQLLQQPPETLPTIIISDDRRKNAGRCMTALACNRLAQGGTPPKHVRHTTFEWNGGTFALRNARIVDHHWSTAQISVLEQMHSLASEVPVAYLLTYWDLTDGILHTWVVPEDVAFDAFSQLPTNRTGAHKTVEVSPNDHQLKNAPSAPSFEPYYASSALTDGEIEKVQEAIKTDDLIKQERQEAESPEEETSDSNETSFPDTEDDDWRGEISPGYTEETLAFLLDLPEHTEDGDWHERNKRRYQSVLRDPSQNLVDELRTKYIQQLSPVVAGGKRHLSILKKNDYGKAEQTSRDDWHRCISRLFLFALEDVTRWHLRKDYATSHIDEPEIRGRILMAKLLQRMNRLPRVPQIKRRRTFDVAFNMVLAKALDRVPSLLADGSADDRQRMARLREQWSVIARDIDDPIAAVTAAQWACPPGYRAVLQLARLILIGAAIDPQSNMGGQAFTLSLASIWERALCRMCDELTESGWRRLPKAEHTRRWDDPTSRDDPKRWLNADVILHRHNFRWVLDAKYKRDFGDESRIDRFQMCAYSLAFNADRVSLVYPSTTTTACERILLDTTVGSRRLQIDSFTLPMAKGPQVCRERLEKIMW